MLSDVSFAIEYWIVFMGGLFGLRYSSKIIGIDTWQQPLSAHKLGNGELRMSRGKPRGERRQCRSQATGLVTINITRYHRAICGKAMLSISPII